MTKADLAEMIHNELGFQKKESSDLLESVFSLMKDTLASGEDINISGFGKFEVKQKNDRRGRNPATGETITISSRKILTYKVSSVLKKAINKDNP
jgi:integration host factor subunit alpha